MKVRLYQSFYLKEQEGLLSPSCIPYDNTSNLTPDLREYPQMEKVHEMSMDTCDAYGLISWKFEQKTLISPEKFVHFIESNPHADAWVVNPCYIIDALFINPWQQGELHHPGITALAQDTLDRMHHKGGDRYDLMMDVIPSNYTFYANYFVATPRVWAELFQFSDEFFGTIKSDEKLTSRMMSASGYSGDPNMSHFIFLFERLVPTFFWKKKYKVAKYQYKWEEVASKSNLGEFNHARQLADMKDQLIDADLSYISDMATSYNCYRNVFVKKYPYAFSKE